MTDFQPKPQTPEQVDEGLRNAFRQAIKDGVMDATPYLKQMNSNKEIELLKQEIKMLKSKLSLLEELEKTKSPVEEAYKDWWGEYPSTEKSISETEDMRWAGFQAGYEAAQLKDVGVPECPDEPESNEWRDVALKFGRKLSVFLPYSYDELSPNTWFKWAAFTYDNYMNQRDKEGGYYPSSQTPEPYCPDEPDWYDEVEWDMKDNPKPMDEVINRMVEERKSQKLWNILKDKWGFSEDDCGDIVEAVAEWLPEPQSAAGSQNTFVECSIEGYNDCLKEMKGMLR